MAGSPSPSVVGALRTGRWITPDRLSLYPVLLVAAYVIALGILFATANGGVDLAGRPLGSDFSDVWCAGLLALKGLPALAYDPAAHYAVQQATFHRPDIPYYGWAYPPSFLLVAAPLALLQYPAALVVWQGATLGLYLLVMWRLAPRRQTLVLALAFPATFMVLIHGQNGFLTAALLGGGIALLDKRPWLAGVLFGLISYKPQLGLLLPLALCMDGRWRTLIAGALTVVVLIAISSAAFGPGIWLTFLHSADFPRRVFLEQGGAGFQKMVSLFAAIRLWGGSVPLAYAAQGALDLGVAIAVALLWRSQRDRRLKGAALVAGCLLVTPYCLDYDLILLAPALALLVEYGLEQGFEPYALSFFALAAAAPIVARSFTQLTHIPLGLIAAAGIFAIALRLALTPSARQNAQPPPTDLAPACLR